MSNWMIFTLIVLGMIVVLSGWSMYLDHKWPKND